MAWVKVTSETEAQGELKAAYERVTLYGLTLVPRRRVHYGPINPREAREVFIRGALVAGEYETRAPFFAHNLRLRKDVEALEHKARRRDVLVEGLRRIGWDITPPRAGMFVWAKIPEQWMARMNTMDFAMLLLDQGDVAVSPGSGFGPAGEGYLRMALVENENRLRQAVRQIGRCLEREDARWQAGQNEPSLSDEANLEPPPSEASLERKAEAAMRERLGRPTANRLIFSAAVT